MKLTDYRTTFPNAMSRFGLYLFAFSIPISFVPAELAIGLCLLGWILEGILNRNWQYFKTKLYIPILIYIGWNLVSSSVSPRPGHSLWALADNEWPMFIMLFMITLIDKINIQKKIIHLWLMTSAIAAIYGIWQTFSGYQLHRHDLLAPMGNYFRAVGFNGFYLTFAAFIMSVFLVSFCLSTLSKSNFRWSYIFVSSVSFLAIVGTFARSIWLSLVAAIPIFGFLKGKRLGSIVSISFVLIVLLCLIFVPAIRQRAVSIVIPSENETRLNLWKSSINISKDFPITGIGEDNFDYYIERYLVPGYYDVKSHPHNDYLNVLVNSGIPGIISFLSIWIYIIWKGFETRKNAADPFLKELALGGTLAVIGFMIGGLFQDYYGTFMNCWGWWFVAGMTMTSYKLYKTEHIVKS